MNLGNLPLLFVEFETGCHSHSSQILLEISSSRSSSVSHSCISTDEADPTYIYILFSKLIHANYVI